MPRPTARDPHQVGARNDNNKDGRIPRTPVTIARLAVEQLSEITGRQPDTISGLERTDDGWLLKIEVVELERIPDSTSLMATYEMELDERGQMRSYRRLNRYYRNQAGDS